MSVARDRSQLVFQKLDRALVNLASDQQPESVHGFRTTTRRLETLLEDILPKRDRKQKKLLKMLGRIRKRAGKVRDLDVQLAALRSLKIPQEPRRKTQLMHSLIELRVEHEKKLRKILNKQDIRDLRKRLRRSSEEVKSQRNFDPLAVARKMVAKVEGSPLPVTDAVLHQYRGVVKRARYAVEFATKSAESTEFISQLKRLQDAIGGWHDWLTLTHSAAERLADVGHSSLLAALQNVTRAKFRQAVATLSASTAIQARAKSAAPSIAAVTEPSRKMGARIPQAGERTDSAA
jgi:CHAD domain-containing protein